MDTVGPSSSRGGPRWVTAPAERSQPLQQQSTTLIQPSSGQSTPRSTPVLSKLSIASAQTALQTAPKSHSPNSSSTSSIFPVATAAVDATAQSSESADALGPSNGVSGSTRAVRAASVSSASRRDTPSRRTSASSSSRRRVLPTPPPQSPATATRNLLRSTSTATPPPEAGPSTARRALTTSSPAPMATSETPQPEAGTSTQGSVTGNDTATQWDRARPKKRRRGWKGWVIEVEDEFGNKYLKSPSPEPDRPTDAPPRKRGRPRTRPRPEDPQQQTQSGDTGTDAAASEATNGDGAQGSATAEEGDRANEDEATRAKSEPSEHQWEGPGQEPMVVDDYVEPPLELAPPEQSSEPVSTKAKPNRPMKRFQVGGPPRAKTPADSDNQQSEARPNGQKAPRQSEPTRAAAPKAPRRSESAVTNGHPTGASSSRPSVSRSATGNGDIRDQDSRDPASRRASDKANMTTNSTSKSSAKDKSAQRTLDEFFPESESPAAAPRVGMGVAYPSPPESDERHDDIVHREPTPRARTSSGSSSQRALPDVEKEAQFIIIEAAKRRQREEEEEERERKERKAEARRLEEERKYEEERKSEEERKLKELRRLEREHELEDRERERRQRERLERHREKERQDEWERRERREDRSRATRDNYDRRSDFRGRDDRRERIMYDDRGREILRDDRRDQRDDRGREMPDNRRETRDDRGRGIHNERREMRDERGRDYPRDTHDPRVNGRASHQTSFYPPHHKPHDYPSSQSFYPPYDHGPPIAQGYPSIHGAPYPPFPLSQPTPMPDGRNGMGDWVFPPPPTSRGHPPPSAMATGPHGPPPPMTGHGRPLSRGIPPPLRSPTMSHPPLGPPPLLQQSPPMHGGGPLMPPLPPPPASKMLRGMLMDAPIDRMDHHDRRDRHLEYSDRRMAHAVHAVHPERRPDLVPRHRESDVQDHYYSLSPPERPRDIPDPQMRESVRDVVREKRLDHLPYTDVRPVPFPTGTPYRAPEPRMPHIGTDTPTIVLAGPNHPQLPTKRNELQYAKAHADGFEGLDPNLEENARGFVENVKNNLRTLVQTYFIEPSSSRDAFLERIGRDLTSFGWQLTDGVDGALYTRGDPPRVDDDTSGRKAIE